MTRPLHKKVQCPHCLRFMPYDTPFSRWVRSHPGILSKDGYVISDLDYVVHRFKTDHGRDIQYLMIVEVKTGDEEIKPSQHDTLHLLSQCLRNTRDRPGKKSPGKKASVEPLRAISSLIKKKVTLRLLGAHLLWFSDSGPHDSARIEWDNKIIDTGQLAELLRFERHPDTLKKMDNRSHHSGPDRPLFE